MDLYLLVYSHPRSIREMHPFAARNQPDLKAFHLLRRQPLKKNVYPPSQKATGVNPWMNARRVPSVALAKEGMLRRVPPDEMCGEVPRP